MKDQDAVSPVIGTLLVLAMFTVTAATVITVVYPELVEYEERGQVDVVATQIVTAVTDARQLAISGSTSEVRQPLVQLVGGDLQIDGGHTVVATVGQFDDSSDTGITMSRPIGYYSEFIHGPADLTGVGGPDLGPAVDGSDYAVDVTYRNQFYVGSNAALRIDVARWDSTTWQTVTTAAWMPQDGDSTTVQLVPNLLSPDRTIRDGPYRIQYTNLSTVPESLLATSFVYDQTSLTYRFHGESGPRTVYGENGGVIRGHDGRYNLASAGLVRPPDHTYGNELFTVRSVRLNATGAASAGGDADVGLLMRLNATENFLFDVGANQVRYQFWGNHPLAWEAHLIDQGFKADADPTAGVYYAREKTSGRHHGFPVHFIDSQIDVRMKSV